MAHQVATSETIKLEFPFEHDGTLYEEITLRRPKVRDLKAAQKHKDSFIQSVMMLANLTELPPEVIEELDSADFQLLAKKVGEYAGVMVE